MKLILASNSPRRRILLEDLGVSFEVRASNVKEDIKENIPPYEVAVEIAHNKAQSIAESIDDDAIIIAADTIVVAERILGKPTDEENAYQMLKELSGRSHEVVTGMAIIQRPINKVVIDYCVTRVFFKELTDLEIRKYIATGEPMDKAGAYGIQGRAALFVEGIEGDYFNVVGIPLYKLQQLLTKHFEISLI